MRQRQRKLSRGVAIAATCTRLPPTPALASTAARASARAGGLGVLHLQHSSIQFLPIELLDRRVGPFSRRHLDKAEAARTPGLAVHHDRRRLDDARLGEHLTQPLRGCRKSQAADEEFLSHDAPPPGLPPGKGTPWYAEDCARVVVW